MCSTTWAAGEIKEKTAAVLCGKACGASVRRQRLAVVRVRGCGSAGLGLTLRSCLLPCFSVNTQFDQVYHWAGAVRLERERCPVRVAHDGRGEQG